MKKSAFYIIASLSFLFVFTILFKINPVYAAKSYNGSNIGSNVEINKTWKISFNKELDKSTINESSIIVTDSSGNTVPVKINIEDNGCVVDVTPQGNYKYGQAYSVTVKSGIKTSNGDTLKSDTKMEFSTRTNQSTNNKYTVTIDAAHGGSDNGNVSASGIKEKDIDLSVALKTGKILEQNGVNVVYTRKNDSISWSEENDIQSRIDISNKANSNEFVSIRANTYPDNTNVKGIETYYSTTNSDSKTVADDIQKQLIASTGSSDRGTKESLPQHKILSGNNAPSVMVELGFITNESESKLMNSQDFQDKSAKAIANGILASLNVIGKNQTNAQPSKPTPVTPAPSKSDSQTPSDGNGPTIVIDPGHGVGQDVGSEGNGYQEDDVTLNVALKTGEILKQKGVNVIYTRTEDERKTSSLNVTQSLQRRCDTANNSSAKFMVAIHTNAFDSPDAEGTETLYYTGNSEGERIATLIQNSLVSHLGTYDRGLKDGSWLYITRNTKMTTVLTELGFLTNSKDASILGTESGREKAAEGLAEGILKALGI
ncbi:N-acetylmuramoyl-L-alanine amidase [Clostridium algifaecis]|uniref:N-acetylmuramoyl-L-alanine amidase n=1 Tax=Clostridium algifaecis TaxID=1472040 RepID=A0ABS4KQN3_9CLOT|nr:N-acetylmuramoyl-L-alanine amidase [Clostridium algifaecis]MBP2032338.1 N-acetylmuramoyl-L-alanine amidase [Clostridium algifaecis]